MVCFVVVVVSPNKPHLLYGAQMCASWRLGWVALLSLYLGLLWIHFPDRGYGFENQADPQDLTSPSLPPPVHPLSIAAIKERGEGKGQHFLEEIRGKGEGLVERTRRRRPPRKREKHRQG